MALPGDLSMSEKALERVLRGSGLGELPFGLAPSALWLTDAERAEENRLLEPEIAALPIYERAGVLDREFEDSLRCLAHPETSYVAMIHVHEEIRYVLACARAREAIVAVRENGTVTLRQTHVSRLPEALIAALPAHPPARFTPFSVPFHDEQLRPSGYLRSAHSKKDWSHQLWDELMAREQVGGGQIVLELRDALGRARRTEEPLVYVDADLGRWSRSTEHRGASRYVFCAPLPREDFAGRLHAMREQLTS